MSNSVHFVCCLHVSIGVGSLAHQALVAFHYVEISAIQAQQQSPSVENANTKKGAHVCTKSYIHRDCYDRTLAPKREIDVLRAISPAGSHLERQD